MLPAHVKKLFEGEELPLSDLEREVLEKSNQEAGPGSQAVFSLYSARISQRAIREHAQALRGAAAAASEHSKTLVRATWWLAVATVVLAAATVRRFASGDLAFLLPQPRKELPHCLPDEV